MARFQALDSSRLDSSDLFRFDTLALRDDILLIDGRTASKVEYDEYVVFKKDSTAPSGLAPDDEGGDDVSFKLNHDEERPGYQMLDLAFRRGWVVDHNGDFTQDPARDPALVLDGRVRRVICFRRNKSFDRREDGITMTPQDMDALDLHPATLQYSRRVTNESRFWSLDQNKLSLILSFSNNPRTPYDFMSLTYDIRDRLTTVLVRQSFYPRQHNLENLDEYDQRLEACRAHWAHPFITPVVLLQVQFMRTEEAVMENISHVRSLEFEVSNIAGFEAFEIERERRSKLIRRLTSTFNANNEKTPTVAGPMSMANLMKSAHDVLKESIKLLDTVRWMERVVKLMLQSGDELAQRMSTGKLNVRLNDLSAKDFMDDERDRQDQQDQNDEPPTGPPSRSSASTRRRSLPPAPDPLADPLGNHWHEIRQYLEGLQRMCMGLETDRRMSEARCRAQIDIIYSKMAQEDNVLNARMAVASSRDSSSMKALAVITAIFLPGEFLGTLFGMSMFDWQASGEDADGTDGNPESGSTNPKDPIPVLSHLFWVYWATVIPLTVGILFAWRAWWVSQDRYFRRHLSRELSEERYWTSDGKPRELEHSFWHDFFYLSVRRDERPAATGDPYSTLDLSPSLSQDKDDMRSPREATVRRGQISFLRSQSLRQRNHVAV
ncbi:hypothetical protein CkaCkLH20_08879 [Colletotrichum karsti]|uniref:Uncharacterized protein n=1 Tax=Colletotrichum karsti TaxID=1095194 RepID=A0A9P6HZZ6_9PEZI|nr:uncharacterized protein CkaCkLH20_08879 [Colletotrichum karsti]KAF9873769.1 hypothetical protein CkaCkLH20_08879 [Colletotrichum karsti]